MAINQQYTLSQLVSDTCVLVGIPVPTDVAASGDPVIKQLVALTNLAGQELMGLSVWPVLVRQVQLVPVTQGGVCSVTLPVDFYKLVNQTVINAATGVSIYGASTPQLWTRVYSGDSVIDVQYRIIGDAMYITPPISDPIVVEYQTNLWVKDSNLPDVSKMALVNNGDIAKLDGQLVEALTRVKYLESKDFDSTAALRDYRILLDQRMTVNEGAVALEITGPVVQDWGVVLGGQNLPPVVDPGGSGTGSDFPYDISFTYDAWVGSDISLLRYPTPVGRTLRIPENFAGSRIICDVPPTNPVVLSIVKNQTQTIGTISFATGSSVGTFLVSGETFLSGASGDVLEVISPTIADVTFAKVGGTIVCSRSD